MPSGNLGKLYVSAKAPIRNCTGAEISLYETKETHYTYEVVPKESIMTLSV